MGRIAILALAAGTWLPPAGAAQEPSKDALRQALKDADLEGNWIYDDAAAGFAEARATGKPVLLVFR
jgi:hypothetical protein